MEKVKKTNGRMKKRELLYWGVDLVKCFINEHENKNKNFKKLKGLSENSNQLIIKYNHNNLIVTKMPYGGKYQYLYSISLDSISVGFIGLYGGQSPDMLEITGQGLTIFGEQIFYFLFNYFGLNFIKFKRIDLCFDMGIDINYFYNRILDEKFKPKENIEDTEKKIKPWISKKNGLETLDIGEKNIKKNSYSFIRIYNKILDSKGKGKLFLYDNLYKKDGKYKEVTRFEIEMREDLVKKFSFDYLKQYDFQFYRIVKSFYGMNSQFFKFLKDEDFFEFKKKYNSENKGIIEKIKNGILGIKTNTNSQDKIKKIIQKKENQEKYGNDFIDEEDKQRTITMFLSYGGRLLGNSYTYEDLLNLLKNKFDN